MSVSGVREGLRGRCTGSTSRPLAHDACKRRHWTANWWAFRHEAEVEGLQARRRPPSPQAGASCAPGAGRARRPRRAATPLAGAYARGGQLVYAVRGDGDQLEAMQQPCLPSRRYPPQRRRSPP